ncbi:MAG: riboflavin biosynthesis protein RibD [Acidobacteriaceae bacterium]|nr:riboflavin biosynthesis protein RibD [Acidobacteriaceae bacterium]
MQRAIHLAADTIGLASPNPQVGCVLTRAGELIAEGAHLYDQRDHAEIAALKQAAQRGIDVIGATAYVTLEPCSHYGRTGPCADALIAARIARCVVATQDPNPLVSGQGIAKLRGAGIEVTVGVLQQEARTLNDAFAHFIQHRRPFVTLKAALSVDGKLAPPPNSRTATEPHWITGSAARAEVQRIRHASDAILTGIGTVLADNPTLTDRSHPPRRCPLLRVVLDAQLRTPLTSNLVESADRDLLILHSPDAPEDRIRALALAGAELHPISIDPTTHHLDLTAVLNFLGERQILSLLLEAGSQLNGAFLSQNLVDKAIVFYGESELGDAAVPFAQGLASPFLFQQSLLHTTHTMIGPDAMITGYLHSPWPTASKTDTR